MHFLQRRKNLVRALVFVLLLRKHYGIQIRRKEIFELRMQLRYFLLTQCLLSRGFTCFQILEWLLATSLFIMQLVCLIFVFS